MESRSNRGQRRKMERTRRANQWNQKVTRTATTLSVAAAVVLLGGFAYGTYAAIGGVVGSGMAETPPSTPSVGTESPHKSSIRLVAVGDSLAHGFGDVTGRGFVGDVADSYRQSGYGVVQSDVGIDGLTSKGLLQQLKEPSIVRLIATADVVLVSIGGNDLNEAVGLPNVNMARVNRVEKSFLGNLSAMMRVIRSVNRSALIVMVGLYNPYGDVAASRMQTNAIVETWNMKASSILGADEKSVFVPTFDLFQNHLGKYLYLDHFHPNELGYARMASRIWQDLGPK